jgi:DNA-binding FadR family transcriptional regulator
MNDVNVDMVRSFLLGSRAADGEKLPTERTLAEELGVSRNVIRKALAALEMQGRVVRKVGSGTYFVKAPAEKVAAIAGVSAGPAHAQVLDVNPKQIIEARFAFEPYIAGVAAMNCTTLDLERMTECARQYHLANNFDAYEVADEQFHVAIVMATHNSVLVNAYQSFVAANAVAEWGSIRQRLLTAERRVASRNEHDKILSAIRSRDSGAAVGAVREHLQYIASALLQP